ncbi:MAG: hypothetical protein KY453_10495, partial [Gemmatimonadetes bacterium]|nr:hypothetical protein [Gemmatimonadota bacterium]
LLDIGEAPRLFILPWDAKQASKLQRIMEGAEGKGKLKMKGDRNPGEFFLEKAPPNLIPEKTQEPEGFVYERAN